MHQTRKQSLTVSRADKPPAHTGPLRVWHAFFYSLSGLQHAALHESAFRQELVLAIFLTLAAVLLPVSYLLKLLVIFSHFLVLIVELLNTAIESVVDKASPEYHELAKQAKDMGSAAVLLSIVFSLICWGAALYWAI